MLPARTRARPTAFSLIEMLVVIGIIVVLIGILIPVIKSVRENAWNADTQNLISQIVAASTRYYQDFNAYPGVFSNPAIVEGGITIKGFDTTSKKGDFDAAGITDPKVTMAENLTLALLGGAQWKTATVLEFDQKIPLQTRGPRSLNKANPKQFPAYMNVREGNLSEGKLRDDSRNPQPGAQDTEIPEFMDTWPDGSKRPIIFVRSRNGAEGAVSDFRNDRPAPGSHLQYDVGQYAGYLTATDGLTFDPPAAPAYAASSSRQTAFEFFKHPNSGGAATGQALAYPREKDRFLMLAAGKDRIFGTNDDITSAGGGQ